MSPRWHRARRQIIMVSGARIKPIALPGPPTSSPWPPILGCERAKRKGRCDVSDHEKTKEQLLEELAEIRRREEQWRSVVANTPVFVALVDRAGTIQYLNHLAPGHILEDTIGKSVYGFIEPDYREVARECIERVFATGQGGFFEPVAAGPNGSLSWYETYAGPVKANGQVVAAALVSRDITRQKRAEAKLRESEERFKLFMDNSPAIAWLKDEQGRYVYVNPSLREACWSTA